MTKKPQYVLNVEGVANWKIDLAAGFTTLGLSDRRKGAFSKLDKGDVLITYVTGTGFVDLRQIEVRGVEPVVTESNYPMGTFPWRVRTRLIVSAGLDRALSPHDFPQTSLCAGDWRYRFRQSGRLLDAADGRLISQAVHAAAKRR